MEKAGLDSKQAVQFLTDTNRIDAITTAASHGNTIIIDAGANRDLAGTAAVLDSIKNNLLL